MRLYNKGLRSFIINKEDAISGCRTLSDEVGKHKAYIDPDKTVEVRDEIGEKLLNLYPTVLMKMRDGEDTPKEVKKKKVKKSKKG